MATLIPDKWSSRDLNPEQNPAYTTIYIISKWKSFQMFSAISLATNEFIDGGSNVCSGITAI